MILLLKLSLFMIGFSFFLSIIVLPFGDIEFVLQLLGGIQEISDGLRVDLMGIVLGGAEVVDRDVIPLLFEYSDPREQGLVGLDIGLGQIVTLLVMEDIADQSILISGLG